MSHDDFSNYKRCQKCERIFRNYVNPMICPVCKSGEFVINLIKRDKEAKKKIKIMS